MRFSANEPRLSESVEIYKEAGFEVRLEPLGGRSNNAFKADTGPCQVCYKDVEGEYSVIYTRPIKKQKAES